MNKANECTCPSGDGSLVHPCPAHPAVEQAGTNVGHGHVFPRADGVKMRCGGPGLCSECTADASRARAALAQPSGEVVVTKNESGAIVSVTRQDKEGRVLSVIAESATLTAQAEQAEAERPEGPTEDELEAAGLGYPLHKEEAVKLWYSGFRSEVITVLEAWEAIGHDIGMNPDKGELLDSLRYMLEKCEAHDAALAEVERLRESKGDPSGSFDRCMKMMYERDENAKRLDAALARVAELEKGTVYVEARQCDECQHVGINDSADGLAACHDCDWTGPEPDEDKCPDCQRENCMAAACPQCGGRYDLVAEANITAPAGQVPQAWLDVQAERRRQITAEGWTPEHDDLYCAAELPRAAAAYILNGANDEAPAIWPFSAKWWKPSTARRDMVKACALALAEIERLDRAASGKEVGHE